MDTASPFSRFDRLKKLPGQAEQDESLLEDIRRVCRQMDAVYARFEYEEDEDLVEAAIFELEALKARYRYLIKRAKKEKLESSDITAIYAVDGRGYG